VDSATDGLEHWLQDLRTDLSNDPPDWLDSTALPEVPEVDEGRHHVDDLDPRPSYGDGQPAPRPTNAGRHRARD
jgi:hypothetical protein